MYGYIDNLYFSTIRQPKRPVINIANNATIDKEGVGLFAITTWFGKENIIHVTQLFWLFCEYFGKSIPGWKCNSYCGNHDSRTFQLDVVEDSVIAVTNDDILKETISVAIKSDFTNESCSKCNRYPSHTVILPYPTILLLETTKRQKTKACLIHFRIMFFQINRAALRRRWSLPRTRVKSKIGISAFGYSRQNPDNKHCTGSSRLRGATSDNQRTPTTNVEGVLGILRIHRMEKKCVHSSGTWEYLEPRDLRPMISKQIKNY
uniref:Uncharacterized protein n=1 Tax=Glossina austeni TaxID=7395 RepID=A0A1A9UEW2_GLOAU